MQLQTSIKKPALDYNYLVSYSPKTILQQQMHELQQESQDELISKLQAKKRQICSLLEQMKASCHNYFLDLTNTRINKQIDAQTLEFLEEIQNKIEEIRENQQNYNSNSQIYQIIKLLSKNFVQNSENLHDIQKILNDSYNFSLQAFDNNTHEKTQVASMKTEKIFISASQFKSTNKKIYGDCFFEITEKQFERALEKLQERQQKQMLLNQRLKKKLKSFQDMISKKGINIKDLNKFVNGQSEKYLQEYWDLELQRIKGENSLLTQQINSVSNKLIELASQNEQLKNQCKKISHFNLSLLTNQDNSSAVYQERMTEMESNSRTMELQSFIPSQTLLSYKAIRQQQEPVLRTCVQRNPQIQHYQECEKKNQQLSSQLLQKAKQFEEIKKSLQKQQSQMSELNKQIEEKDIQLEKLSSHFSTLEHDYQVSYKKKFELQQKINLLKIQLKESQEKENYLEIQSKLQISNLEALLKFKEQSMSNLTQKIKQKLQLQFEDQIKRCRSQKQKLETQLIQSRTQLSSIKADSDAKIEKFKEEFKQLQKVINDKDQQLSNLNENLYQLNNLLEEKQIQQNRENSLTHQQNYQSTKKELGKLKKQFKEKVKELDNLKTQNFKINQLLGLKCPQINQRIQSIVKDYEKTKFFYETKIKIFDEKFKFYNQKTQFNLNELIKQNQLDSKKSSILQTLQKYIQAMNNLSAKNAQIKKLKEQIKDLKTIKAASMKIKPKQAIKDSEPLTRCLEQASEELTSIQKSILSDRMKVEKKILEQKLLIVQGEKKLLEDKFDLKQIEINSLNEELYKIKKQIKKNEDSIKKQFLENQLKSQINSLQTTIQKLQSELKSSKNLFKKSQQQLNLIQNDLKKKKQHLFNIKKELASSAAQLEQLNFILKNKNEEIDKLKRQLKDQSTKQVLLTQMKQRVEDYSQLEQVNEDLKKQIDKLSSSYKFEINKLQTQVKELKTDIKSQINQKVISKTNELNQELADFKSKHKKLKTQLERKQTFSNHLKLKYQSQTNDLRVQYQQSIKQLNRKLKECENHEKKIQILSINQRKYRQKCKLLAVIIQKIYTKILNSKASFGKVNQTLLDNQNTISMLPNTSPIIQKLGFDCLKNFASPQEGLKQTNPSSTIQTLAQMQISLEDLQKYSQGLEMFGINPLQLKNFQNQRGLNNNMENQISTFSHFMNFTENKNQTVKNYLSPHNNHIKQKVQQLNECLIENNEIDVAQILGFFAQILSESS